MVCVPTFTTNAVVVHAGALRALRQPPGFGLGCKPLVFFHQGQHPYRRVVLRDQLAWCRQVLKMPEDRMTTVANCLEHIPLGGIGQRHTQHGLIPFDAMKRQSQIIAPHRQDRPRPTTVLFRGDVWGQTGRKHLATR